MPELPEVETVVRDLRAAGLPGLTIRHVAVHWPATLGGQSVRDFRERIEGRLIRSLERRGKYIVAGLSGGWTLLIHLRMTGQFRLAALAEPRGKHEHLLLTLDDGRQLRYVDTRKFGRWRLVKGDAGPLAGLGPEPLSPQFTAARLRESLAGRSGMLKPLLLNQRIVAGLGNIYVDEALWEAGLHPTQSAAALGARDWPRLHAAIRLVLRRGIRARGTTLGGGRTNFRGLGEREGNNQRSLRVFRRTGQACPRCGTAIQRLRVAQRSSHVCPKCQRVKPEISAR
jgi:formamidopyrimidine-DNA glycosylase